MNKIRSVLLLLWLVQTTVVSAQSLDIVVQEEPPPYLIPTSSDELAWPIDHRCYLTVDIPKLINLYAREIANYCNFDPDQAIHVPLDDAQLLEWLDDSGNSRSHQRGYKQILLLNAEYHISKPVRIAKKAPVICGLRHWLKAREPGLFEQLLTALPRLRQTTGHSGEGFYNSGSGSGALLSEPPTNHSDSSGQVSLAEPEDERVKLFFSHDGSNNPSLLFVDHARFRHLRIYRVGEPGGAGLLAAGCNHREYYCPNNKYGARAADLHNCHVEDLTGGSEFMIRVETWSTLRVTDSTFNFLHKPGDSKVFDLKKAGNAYMNNVDIHNSGSHGTVIFWSGFQFAYERRTTLKNINITATAGSTITGVKFKNGKGQFSDNRDTPRLTNFTFGENVAVGFSFPDNSMHVQKEGNTGNRMENPEGIHCLGAPSSGIIYFTDGTECFSPIISDATDSTPTESDATSAASFIEPTTSEPAIGEPAPERSSAVRSGYQWSIWVGLMSLYSVASLF